MKAQMFVIGVIIILISLILIRNMFTLYSAMGIKKYEEGILFDKNIENIDHELQQLSGLQKFSNASELLYNFSLFLRTDTTYIKLIYIHAFYNDSKGNVSVSIGNFFDDKMKDVSLNITNSTPTYVSIGTIDDKSFSVTEFTPNINGTVNITVSYTMIDNYTYILPVYVSSNSSTGLFDIKLEYNDRMLRRTSVYSIRW